MLNKRFSLIVFGKLVHIQRIIFFSLLTLPLPGFVSAATTQTVVLQQGINGYMGADDTKIDQDTPTTNYGGAENIYFNDTSSKAIIRFDLATIPATATINSAILSLYIYANNDNAGGNTIKSYRVLKNWVESQATWKVYATGMSWSGAGMKSGSDYASSAAATTTVDYSPVNMWANINLTSLVSSWVKGTYPNYGVMFRSGNGPRPFIYSSEYRGDLSLRPKLTITYTSNVSDGVPPTVPVGVTASPASSQEIDLTWSPSTDNVGVAGYKVFRDGSQIVTTASTSYSNTGLSPATSFTYTVAAFDAAGNTSATSTPVSATTLPDTQPPSIPQNLIATAQSSSRIDLTWSPSTDDIGVTGYKVFRDGSQIATTASTSYSNTGLSPATSFTYTVAAFDAAGNTSAASTSASTTTLPDTPPDTQPPSIPQNLTATAQSSSRIDLTWSPSTDNIGVTGYKVFRDGAQVATTASNSYSDTSLLSSNTYSYTVVAFDAAGNPSAASAPASATTLPNSGFTFLTYGDSNAYGGDCTANNIHISLVNRMVADNPDLVIRGGDMISGLSNKTNFIQNGACTAPDSYGSLRDIIAPLQNRLAPPGLPTSVFPVIGNHDDGWGDHWYPDPYGNGFCDVFNPQALIPNHTQQPYFSGIGATRYTDSQFYNLACSKTDYSVYSEYMYYSFNYRNSHFVVLRINSDYFDLQACNNCRSNKADYGDYYNIHQLDFLRADLDSARQNPQIENIFVFLHAPLFSTGESHPNNPSWKILGQEFSSHRVKAVFSGHNHGYERTVPILVNNSSPNGMRDDLNGTVYITTGGGGSPLYDFKASAWYDAYRVSTYHYIRVVVNGALVTIQAVDANSNVIDSYTW